MKSCLIAIAVAVGLLATRTGAMAQSEYEVKALRFKPGGWSVRIVAGENDLEVTKLGMFPSRDIVPLLQERSDIAADLYLEFRARQIQGSVFVWSGIALMVAGVVVGEENRGVAVGLFLGGLGVELFGISRYPGAADRLHKSIWKYNSTFACD